MLAGLRLQSCTGHCFKTHFTLATRSMAFYTVSRSHQRKARIIPEWCFTGVHLVIYFNIIQVYLKRTPKNTPQRDMFYMVFSTVLLFLNTIFVATQSLLGQEMWVINMGSPGGAAAYFVAFSSVWYQTMGSTASVLLQSMSDGLLVSVL
jgi:hypothetical protein